MSLASCSSVTVGSIGIIEARVRLFTGVPADSLRFDTGSTELALVTLLLLAGGGVDFASEPALTVRLEHIQ